MLTSRAREVVQLIAEGRLNKQVAHMLDISIKTIETHRAAVMHKLKLPTTAGLCAMPFGTTWCSLEVLHSQ
jgi:FixJ family two-component response regulator